MTEMSQTATSTGTAANPMTAFPNPFTEQTTTHQPTSAQDTSEATGREFFKKKIHYWWNKSIEGILETGWILVEAQATLSADEWAKFVKNDVPFDYSILRKLMKLAQDTKISDPKYKDRLPASWTSLYEIAMMTPATLELGVRKGVVVRTASFQSLRAFRIQHDKPERKKGTAPQKSEPVSKAVLPDSLFESEPNAEEKETTTPATESTQTEAPLDKAAEEIASLTAKLYEGTSQPPQVVPVPTPAKGHVTVTLSREVIDRNQGAVEAIRKLIEGVVRPYDFMDSVVTLEVV
jgi:hypothetical protein